MATNIGRVGIVMKGNYNSASTYEALDAVSYSNGLYIAKQAVPAGTVPTNTTYWQTALLPTVDSSLEFQMNEGFSGGAKISVMGRLVVVNFDIVGSFTGGQVYNVGDVPNSIKPNARTYSSAITILNNVSNGMSRVLMYESTKSLNLIPVNNADHIQGQIVYFY